MSPRRPTLAVLVAFASLIALSASSAAGAAQVSPTGAARAAELYFQGKPGAARGALVRMLADPAAAAPAARLPVLETLLDICIHLQDDACVAEYGPQYAAAAEPLAAAAPPAVRADLARRAAYYFDYGRLSLRSKAVTATILDGAPWKAEDPSNPDLYIRRQMLAAQVLMAQDRDAEASRAVDKALSVVATLENPQNGRFTVAWTLSQALSILMAIGETERAYGLYKATGPAVERALAPASPDAAAFHLARGQLLEEIGDLKGAAAALDAGAAVAAGLDLDQAARDVLLGEILTLKTVVAAAAGDLPAARAALERHPSARRGGQAPQSFDEVTYLAARALVGALEQKPDRAAATALSRPIDFRTVPSTDRAMAAYRAVGTALALAPGPRRQALLVEAGRRIVDGARRIPPAGFGAWRRPSTVEQLLIALALTQAAGGANDPDTDFALFQLAGRRGPSFDADALAVLGQAKDPIQRRVVHQALRLHARRDRLEREALQRTAAGLAAPPTPKPLAYDPGERMAFRDFDAGVEAARAGLAEAGVVASGSNLVGLERLQATLAPDEAVLTTAPVMGGLAYMCVRRDTTRRAAQAVDLNRLQLDSRVVQASLTAGHAPSDALDSQFPAEAAVRLYDALIRPFEGCLKPGDHILWLPSVSLTAVPITALLAQAPPKAGQGYDLAAAGWLVRRHAVTYAGSASALVAARSRAVPAADFDFLGLGDPVLTGAAAGGADRTRLLLAGVRPSLQLATLPPLPDTRDELLQSANGFRDTKILVGEAATEQGFRSQLLGSYRYLSFATHGLIRDDLQGLAEPALALTPVSAADSANDGLLTANEIADLNLSAWFVALSACNTANFDLTQMSAELPALASAFAVAGVPSTLATLWPVESSTSRHVVSAVFAGLRARPGQSPAAALATAQRAFLAAPPGRAYLHPRFWAPFVVLGDGGTARAPAPAGARVASVEALTHTASGGEVLALARSGGRTLARFIADADAGGRSASGVAAVADGAPAWRRESQETGAMRVLFPLGSSAVVGGYATDAQGRAAPVLETFEIVTGTPGKTWRGETPPGLDTFVLAAVPAGADRAVFATAGRDLTRGGADSRLELFALDASLSPKPLAEVALDKGAVVDEATLTALGDRLLLTYTQRYAIFPRPSTGDEYDRPACRAEPVTWIELRDSLTGRRLAGRVVRGLIVTSALAGDGRALLAGSFRADCRSEARAAVLAADGALQTRALFTDASAGASEARALQALPDGRTFLAASKETVVDYGRRPRSRGYDPNDLRVLRGAMLLTLGPDGTASAPRMLDSGSDLFVSAAEAGDPSDIRVGGSIGGDAAIFHLAAPP